MYKQEEILAKIKSLVQEEIPDAKIYLFGSRVTGKVHDESDWDVLILTSSEVDKKLKHKINHHLFYLGLELEMIIDTVIVNEKQWLENPSYYVLRHSIRNKVVAI